MLDPCGTHGEHDTKGTGREGATNTNPALGMRTCKGGPGMPEITGNIGVAESASNSSQNKKCDSWKSIGALAAGIVKAVQK